MFYGQREVYYPDSPWLANFIAQIQCLTFVCKFGVTDDENYLSISDLKYKYFATQFLMSRGKGFQKTEGETEGNTILFLQQQIQ